MFCAGRVPEEDLKRTMKACGGSIQTTVQNLTPDVLGTCELFEEVQLGGERYVVNTPLTCGKPFVILPVKSVYLSVTGGQPASAKIMSKRYSLS